MAFRIVSALMAVLFLWSAAIQFNDPDPLQWVLLYGAAGIAAALGTRGSHRFPQALPALVGVAALVWALLIGSGSLGQVGLGGLFQSYEMKSQEVEEGREFLGLLIVAVWMLMMVLFRRRAKA